MRSDTEALPGANNSEANKAETRGAVLEAKRLLYKRLKVQHNSNHCLCYAGPFELAKCTAQVVVHDGRELIGELLCLDKEGNLVLGNTYEQVSR